MHLVCMQSINAKIRKFYEHTKITHERLNYFDKAKYSTNAWLIFNFILDKYSHYYQIVND